VFKGGKLTAEVSIVHGHVGFGRSVLPEEIDSFIPMRLLEGSLGIDG
jgi:hypothetical protein